VWDLVNTRTKYPKLVPILLAHLSKNYPERIREGIARALAVREARAAWDKLVAGFLNEDGPVHPELGVNQVKWAFHLAIAAAADVSVLDDLIKLAADRRHGHHRSYFVDALARIDDPRARAALDEIKGDTDLAEAFKRLAKRKKARK
jgi:DNA-binding GntR family transcriptional regulator